MNPARRSPLPSVPAAAFRLRLGAAQLLITLGIMVCTTSLAFLVRPARGEVSGALVFMLGVVSAGALSGLAAALIAATAGFLLYNFYFAEPILTLRVDSAADIVPLVIFNLSALIAGALAGRLRDREQSAASANASLVNLLDVSRKLQSAMTLEDVRAALPDDSATPLLLRLSDDTSDGMDAAPPFAITLANKAIAAPDGTARQGDLVGYRLDGLKETLGALLLWRAAGEPSDRALAHLVALALERARLLDKVAGVEAAARAESLKTALLSSVSHDFRTPLTTISASASSLIEYGDKLEPTVFARLLRGIVDECDRLNRYTANLLEMTKLEAGAVAPRQALSAADVVAAAIRRIQPRAGSRRIRRSDNGEDPVVVADATLFELTLVNVLENAIVYSQEGSRIEIELVQEDGCCRIKIADEGCGVPDTDLVRIFDRFYRVPRTDAAPPGSGLGLAIAAGFVHSLGGDIQAATPGLDERGTCISIRLPLALEAGSRIVPDVA